MARKKARVTLIHNDQAGDARHCRDQLIEMVERVGYSVRYVAYKRCDLTAALDRSAELVAIAGGDGTVAKVAAQARPDGPPLAILPLGTANNIAKSFGIEQPIGELVAGWPAQQVRPFHLIEATGPWGRCRLAEGIGFGALEQGIAAMPKDPDFAEARHVLRDAVLSAPAERLELRLENETISQFFALLEISTVPLVGPNLRLAAPVDPSHPKFAICFIGDSRDERGALARWLAAPDAPAPVAVRVADRLAILGRFRRVRLNGDVRDLEPEGEPGGEQQVTLTSEPEPLRILVPP